ncbi:hypothetical protein GCM10023148_00210 [Actinokineospora soli]
MSEEEISTAIADVRRKERTGRWQEIESATQTAAIDEHEADLDEVATSRDEVMTCAAEIISLKPGHRYEASPDQVTFACCRSVGDGCPRCTR